MPRRPRVAIAHDYLTQRGGAERVVLPCTAPSRRRRSTRLLYDPDSDVPGVPRRPVVTSPINRVGALRRDHRAALPLLPYAVSQLRIDADVVVASSSGWAHGVPTPGRKIVYCHAPARWLYQSDRYLGAPARSQGRRPRHAGWLRRWDRRAAASADPYLANSRW